LAPPPDRPPDAPPPACPCGHDNLAAELAGQRPLLERAATGDREAFAQLYDAQVDGIYRYLLAWTGGPADAAKLTAEVFSGAFSWLTVTHDAEGEVAAWLTAMARDAVAQRRGSGVPSGAADPVAAVAQLSDPKREVVVLRLLCGHSLDHTAHLSGFTRRAVQELQLSACRSVWELTSGATTPPTQEPAAEEFEHHLAQGDPGPPGPHATLAGPLAVAQSLRQAARSRMAGPDPALVERLRQSLLTGTPLDPRAVPVAAPLSETPGSPTTRSQTPKSGAPGSPTARSQDPQSGAPGSLTTRSRGPRTGRVAQRREGWRRLSTGLVEARLLRRPWLATGVATAGIVAVLTLQAFGEPARTGACGGRPCPATTTVGVVAAAGSGSLRTPRTTVLQPSTTSTVAAPAPGPSAPRSSAATTPPSTRPATTAPPTTAPRPTTTTRATTTTAPTTTVATTTTAAPAPT
jgi:DNA-directed RNA polymerase specialized sigma24 family protein